MNYAQTMLPRPRDICSRHSSIEWSTLSEAADRYRSVKLSTRRDCRCWQYWECWTRPSTQPSVSSDKLGMLTADLAVTWSKMVEKLLSNDALQQLSQNRQIWDWLERFRNYLMKSEMKFTSIALSVTYCLNSGMFMLSNLITLTVSMQFLQRALR